MPLTKVASSMLASGTSGSGGSAGKNYISSYNGNSCNGDFESGSISGWNVCSVTGFTNGVPNSAATIISSPGVNDPALSLLSTGQLAGQFSLQSVFPTTAVNEGFISDIFTIDAEDQAKVLTFKFYYNLSSSSGSVNFSGTSSNAFLVAIYDQTNLAWIQPAGLYSMTQSSGTGIATGTFQTTSNSTQYRFAIFCASVTGWTGSATLKFDDFSVGPQTSPIGAVATDWVSYTPTLKGTGSDPTTGTGGSISGRWRRIGDSIQVQCQAVAGTTPGQGSGSYYFTLPSGYNLDTSKISYTVGSENLSSLGSAVIFNSGVQGYVGYPSPVSGITNGLGMAVASTPIGLNSPAATWWSSGDSIQIYATVPIVGWSSNVQTSNDTDTRVVSFSAFRNATQAVTADVTDVLFAQVNKDSHGAFSGNNTYTIPVAGDYTISASIGDNAAASLGIRLYVNTVQYRTLCFTPAGQPGSGTIIVPNLKAGDTITIRSSASLTLSVGGYLSIQRISGPSVIAASETVGASYYASSNTSTAAGSPINFAGKDYDTHNAVTIGASWRFTAPISGTYSVKTFINTSTNPSTSNYMNLHKNGSLYASIAWGNISDAYSGTLNLQLLAGDYIFLTPSSSTMVIAGNASRSSTSGVGAIQIQRVGN